MIQFHASGIDLLVQLLRYRVSDLKVIYNNITLEEAGLASGTYNEVFYTANMPLASGFDTHLRCGRWYYNKYDTALEITGGTPKRGYLLSIDSGSFLIPTGAINATTGDRVRLSYTYEEEQPYKFSDQELKLFIGDSINKVNNGYHDFGFDFSTTSTSSGTTFSVSPVPTYNDLASHMYTQYASILIKEHLEAEGFGDRIYVKDINITIDTSKGLNDLGRSLKDLRTDFTNIINKLKLEGQISAFGLVDTYSTEDINLDYNYRANYLKDDQIF